MKQVLLAPQDSHRPIPPVVMWMPDTTLLGDLFRWRRKTWVVSTVYSTSFPGFGCECRRSEKPHHHPQAGIVLDHHGDSTHPGN